MRRNPFLGSSLVDYRRNQRQIRRVAVTNKSIDPTSPILKFDLETENTKSVCDGPSDLKNIRAITGYSTRTISKPIARMSDKNRARTIFRRIADGI